MQYKWEYLINKMKRWNVKMLNLDLKARLKNKSFWVAIVSTIVLLTQQLGVNIFPSNWADILNTILTILIILGVVVDTSTKGISDQVSSKYNQGNAITVTSAGIETKGALTIKDDSINAKVQPLDNLNASSKITVDNPDNIQSIGNEVNAISAAAPQ
jgi:phi LC3 family holin